MKKKIFFLLKKMNDPRNIRIDIDRNIAKINSYLSYFYMM